MRQTNVQVQRWAILWVLSLSLFLVILDNSITNVALPSLARDLHASISQLQWIVDSYSLVFAGLLLPMGSLADRIGRRRMLLSGLVVFAVCSVVAAIATTPAQLIAARAAQGVGAAMVFPCTLAILINVFTEPVERAKAIALWSTTAGLAVALGPVIGGGLLEHFWWGSTFLVNVPVVAVSVYFGARMLPESKDPSAGRFDAVGLLCSVTAIVSIVYAVIEAPRNGWTSPTTLGLLALGTTVGYLFVKWERHTTDPMLDVRVFTNARFSAATIAIAIGFFSLLGSIFLITQYLQVVRGYSTFSAGLHTLPFAVGAAAAGPIASRLDLRIGTRITVTLGMVMMAGGYWWLSHANTTTSYWGPLAGPMILVAAGLTITTAPATEAVMGCLPPEKAGVGSAVNDTSRELGGTLGVAVLGSVFSSAYAPKLTSSLAGLPIPPDALKVAKESVIAAVMLANQAPAEMRPMLIAKAQAAFLDGLASGLRVGALVCVVGAVVAARFLPARAATPLAATPEPERDRQRVATGVTDPWDVFFAEDPEEMRNREDELAWATGGSRPSRFAAPSPDDWDAGRPGWPPVTYEYAVLALQQQDYDRVLLPDGSLEQVPRNEGVVVVQAWFDRHVRPSPQAASAAHQAWEARYANWRSQVRVAPGEPGDPRRRPGSDPAMVFIRLPDGAVHTAPSAEVDELLRAHYASVIEREPRSGAPSFKEWARHADVHIGTTRGWSATLRYEHGDVPLGFSTTDAGAGPRMPGAALATLNSLGRQGWELLSIDEGPDGGEPQGRTGPGGALHYVLKRATTVSSGATGEHRLSTDAMETR